jgi:RNA polymerase sigma-70 factor (ECF subfamily)
MNEEAVISDILAGNVNRYEEIVREYQDIIANLCFKIGGPRIDVQEMTQQAFVELYSALPRFKFQSKLSTFIYRLTVNVVCKEIKHNSRWLTSQDDPNTPEVVSDDNNVEQAIVQDERYRTLYAAIGRLHTEQRTALVLYTFNDFSYNDIADVMQCTVAKVESLIFRARKNLKKMLSNEV